MLHARVLPRRPVLAPRPLRVLAVLVLLTLAATTLSLPPRTASATEAKPANRPNILLITTDDQTLADLRHMPRTRRLMADRGVTFDGISPHPLCCPARAETLTGQFAQNNGVRSNSGAWGGYKRLHERNTIAGWLNRAGYHTVFMGKYLNGYGPRDDNGPAPGWDDWNPTVGGQYSAHDYRVRHNGKLQWHQLYQTDFFTDLAVSKIRASAQKRAPFFLWQSYMAPHLACPPDMETVRCWRPPVPAKRHRGMFKDAVPPSMRNESFNEADLTDKPYPLVNSARLRDDKVERILLVHRRRLQALQAVDEGVAAMLRALQRTGELRDTLIVFTSDNGYLLGEHRHTGKVLPYEPALQVPMLMRGPGVPRGVVRRRIATPVDLAPTFTSVARARPGLVMDGRDLMPVARRGASSWKSLLIQAGPHRWWNESYGWFYRGVRTDRYTYAYYPYSNEQELYDRNSDPYQLQSLHEDPRYKPVLRALHRRMEILGDCAGSECRRSFDPLPRPLPDLSTEQPPETTEPSPTSGPTATADAEQPE